MSADFTIKRISSDFERLSVDDFDALVHSDGGIFFQANTMDLEVGDPNAEAFVDENTIGVAIPQGVPRSYKHNDQWYVDSRIGIAMAVDEDLRDKMWLAAHKLRTAVDDYRHMFREDN